MHNGSLRRREEKEKKKGAGRIFQEIMAQNFTSLVKNNLHIQETPQTPKKNKIKVIST